MRFQYDYEGYADAIEYLEHLEHLGLTERGEDHDGYTTIARANSLWEEHNPSD